METQQRFRSRSQRRVRSRVKRASLRALAKQSLEPTHQTRKLHCFAKLPPTRGVETSEARSGVARSAGWGRSRMEETPPVTSFALLTMCHPPHKSGRDKKDELRSSRTHKSGRDKKERPHLPSFEIYRVVGPAFAGGRGESEQGQQAAGKKRRACRTSHGRSDTWARKAQNGASAVPWFTGSNKRPAGGLPAVAWDASRNKRRTSHARLRFGPCGSLPGTSTR